MNTDFRPCIVVPCYNHGRELAGYLPGLRASGIPVIVVNDGSNAEETVIIRDAVLANCCELVDLPTNGGKWAAVREGMNTALKKGYTHALQCDADGQHDAAAIPDFITAAQGAPGHMILGEPLYGDDAPSARRKGRCVTNFFVWLETAGACKHDAMCGFRVYPLDRTLRILNNCRISPGMAGDIEILVRLYWDGMPVQARSVKVCYPEGGRSNFRMLRDNVLISWAHTQLCTGALLHPWRLVKAHRPR